MRFLAILNRDGGTLRTTDLDAFVARTTEVLEAAGHELRVEVVSGSGIVEALAKAARSRSADVVLAGGGDGTISAAAACLMGSKKALAILPAGTMNLFARSLGIPLGLDAAIAAFAEGRVKEADMASANERPFIHQFSIGMHARLVQRRSKMKFASRLGKIRASARAAVDTIFRAASMTVTLEMEHAEVVVRTTGIGITNNLFGEGHLPFADRVDQGVLGIYVTNAERSRELLWFFANMAIGRWKNNAKVEIHQSRSVTVRMKPRKKKRPCVIDGELCELEPVTRIKIHPKALKVLVPKRA